MVPPPSIRRGCARPPSPPPPPNPRPCAGTRRLRDHTAAHATSPWRRVVPGSLTRSAPASAAAPRTPRVHARVRGMQRHCSPSVPATARANAPPPLVPVLTRGDVSELHPHPRGRRRAHTRSHSGCRVPHHTRSMAVAVAIAAMESSPLPPNRSCDGSLPATTAATEKLPATEATKESSPVRSRGGSFPCPHPRRRRPPSTAANEGIHCSQPQRRRPPSAAATEASTARSRDGRIHRCGRRGRQQLCRGRL